MSVVPVFVARHFWRNGEFAVWQASQRFPDSLLSWLKTHYAELVAGSRPKWIERPEGRIYLYFLDEREIHGRLATRLTACWLNSPVKSPMDTFLQIKKVIELINNDQVEIEVETKLLTQKNEILQSNSVWIVFFVIIAVGIGWFMTKKQNNAPLITSVSLLQKTIEKPSVIPVPSNKVDIKSRGKSAFNSDVCTNSIPLPKYCYQHFVSEKCKKKTNLQHYDAWLYQLKKQNRSKFINLGCPVDLKHDRDIGKDVKNKSRLNKFLK